jgi:hypothetical protein
MSFTLLWFEVESIRAKAKKAGPCNRPASLNFRQFRGARVALLQSPILRSLRIEAKIFS